MPSTSARKDAETRRAYYQRLEPLQQWVLLGRYRATRQRGRLLIQIRERHGDDVADRLSVLVERRDYTAANVVAVETLNKMAVETSRRKQA